MATEPHGRPDLDRISSMRADLEETLGDGKPAMEAHIGAIADMVAAPDGTVYWTERYSQIGNWKGRLRKLAPDGIVTTVAGNGDKPAQDGNPAYDVAIGSDPKGVALGYSEPTAFHRAFRRWHGTTPQAFRAQASPSPQE